MTTLFDDGKDSGALRTIGELAHALGLKPHVLRYWEQQFPMLLPLKRSGGRRYYRPGDVALVEEIDRLVNREGYTLKGAIKALSSRDKVPAQGLAGAGSRSAGVSTGGQLPGDGGLDTFFGRRPSAQQTAGHESERSPQASVEGAADLVVRLRSIRNRLARALEG